MFTAILSAKMKTKTYVQIHKEKGIMPNNFTPLNKI